jgi:transcriptional regulator CtsR
LQRTFDDAIILLVKESQSQRGVIFLRNISDIIEHHLKQFLSNSEDGKIEIQRNDLADHFQCAPSQINYVISTRFSLTRGYIVESKRGGGGYIRIRKVGLNEQERLHHSLVQLSQSHVSQQWAESLIDGLVESDLLNHREARLVNAAIKRETLFVQLPLRDELRANILRAMLKTLLIEE